MGRRVVGLVVTEVWREMITSLSMDRGHRPEHSYGNMYSLSSLNARKRNMKYLVNRISGLVIGQVRWWVGGSFEVMSFADVLKRNSWTEKVGAGRKLQGGAGYSCIERAGLLMMGCRKADENPALCA